MKRAFIRITALTLLSLGIMFMGDTTAQAGVLPVSGYLAVEADKYYGPYALLLFGSGLLGLAGWRKFRKG